MRIVVVGSGLAGFTVAEALAPQHDVTLVTAETHGYYPRPRLSHAVSNDADLVLKRFGFLAPLGVMAGVRVEAIDRERQEVLLEGQRALLYDVLILATAEQPRRSARLARAAQGGAQGALGDRRRRPDRLRAILRP